MSLERLQQLADDFRSVPPQDYEELADSCRGLALNRLDVRFMVLGECFRLSVGFWGESEGGSVSSDFLDLLARTWTDYLPGILRTASEEEGVAVALALREELSLLGGVDPLTYRAPAE